MEERSVHSGKGHLKFTFSFQSQLHTTPLTVRLLKIVPTQDRRPSSKDSIDCRVFVSLRDFRTLQEINNSFLSKVEKLLDDVQRHQAFTTKSDLIKQRLDDFALAIFPDAGGFVLLKDHDGSSRPQHVLLRIRPTTMELCLPQYRFLLPMFSTERHPVSSLQEALVEFTRSPSWPRVRRGQFGVDWAKDSSTLQPRLGMARVEHSWERDDAKTRDIDAHFVENTVEEHSKQTTAQKDDSVMDTTQWKVDSVKSLVREVARISLHENVSVYFAIEKATLSILSHSDATADAFVESIAAALRTFGARDSPSLGVYKLLASTLDLSAVKKAVMRREVLSMLQEQYEQMTHILARSATSDSNDSHCSFREAHMEVNNMHYFTFPRIMEAESSNASKKRLSVEQTRRQSSASPGSRYQVVQTETDGTTLSTLSVDLVDAHASSRTSTSLGDGSTTPSDQDQRQDVPKLTFYWLTHHDGARATNSGTTHTSISLPDGRSIVFDEDLRESTQLAPRGIVTAHSTARTSDPGSHRDRFFTSQTVIESTLHAWGVQLAVDAAEDPDIPVAFAIKCTILEIMCAFSRLNLEYEIREDCENSRDYAMLHSPRPYEKLQSPSAMSVLELLAPRWQVFPGEQPSIRWGPTERGTQVALAVIHEFACQPLVEVEPPTDGLANTRLFIQQDLNTESYLALLTGARDRLAQILQIARIDTMSLEEITAVMHLLADFVASSPSYAQAQLAAYSCLNTFVPLEASVFKACDTNSWPIPVFRLFHGLLRLFRCMLERATDVVLEEFLINSLLKRDPWVKLVREYSRVVLFSERLEKTCDPEELMWLRSGIWSYHTALVKVVRTQRDGADQDHENLPQDFQNARPTPFGQDPLDFLRYLILPGEGHAPRVLQRRDWEPARASSMSEGGLHGHVLLFLKTLFSLPNNVFVKQRDISTYYLELHWNGFKQSYVQASKGRSYAATIVCRRHLEVIRVLMGHHHVEIFSQMIKLGIMDCLADEIALEAAHSSTLGSFDPPPSQLRKATGDQVDLDLGPQFGEASTSNAQGPYIARRASDLSTDAESGLLSSIEFASSEGLNTHGTFSILASSKASQESWTSLLVQSISFGQRDGPHCPPLETGIDYGTPTQTGPSTGSLHPSEEPEQRFQTFKDRRLRSDEIPSRIPLFRHRRSPSSNDRKEGWRSNLLFSFQKRTEVRGVRSSFSTVSPFETRIPCAPQFRNYSLGASDEASILETATESSRRGNLKALGHLFNKKASASLKLHSTPETSRHRSRSQSSHQVRSTREKFANKLKTKNTKAVLPGLTPPARVTLSKPSGSQKTSSHDQSSFNPTVSKAMERKARSGLSATISYSPTGLHVTRMSVEKESQSSSKALRARATIKSLMKTTRNVPLLNLTSLNSPTKKPGIGHNQLHLSNVSLSSRTRTAKQTSSKELGNENNEPTGLLSHPSSMECATCPTPSITVASGSGQAANERNSRTNYSFDESCDSHGPPTFSIYCGARVDKRPEADYIDTVESKESNLEQPRRLSVQSPPAKPLSSAENPLLTRFQTPSDFEYTGDVVEDCKRLELMEREFYGLSASSDDASSESEIGFPVESSAAKRQISVPLLKMGSRLDIPPPRQPEAGEPAVEIHNAFQADQEMRQLSHGTTHPRERRRRSGASRLSPTQQTPSAAWIAKRNPSAMSGFRTPSDFEYTGDVDEDVKKLERLERMYYGESSPSEASSDDDERDSMLEATGFCPSPAFEPRPVPKLNFLGAERAPSGSLRHPRASPVRLTIETEHSASVTQTDDLSSFSWMHLSTKESVSESEFSALLNGTAKVPGARTLLSPYEAAKEERYVYADVALRSVWVELLLEGMLLEYNTRPARDHDTHLVHVERIIKFVPKVLMHHLEHEVSRPVISLLKKRLSYQAPNIHRLLRLLSSALFPVELYAKKDHIARGAFAHVFRCPIPLEGGPDTCAVKVLDHPVEQNEMSTLMDTYSEISIMEKFKEEPSICHLYDYGTSNGSVYVVMKDYKCSLLEWRKRFPEQSPGALRLFLRIFSDIINAVKVLHDHNVVHFDLKCSNILLEPLPGISSDHFWNPPTEEPPFKVVIADFGEARSYSNNWEARTVRNHGTEFNKSPEMLLIAKAQHTDCPEYDRRKRIGAGPPSDVWALGCLLFELVTGEFLQYDTDWFRFFLRVTTNTMSIVDNKKNKLLGQQGQGVVSDLLEFILVRTHLWRPNLTSLSQKLDGVISSHELPPYYLPPSSEPIPSTILPQVSPPTPDRALWRVECREEMVSFSHALKMARKECLSPWILSENNISLVVCVNGTRPSQTNLHATAARANVELLEISLGDEESVSDGHAEMIVSSVSHSRCLCFTCEEGFESDTFELIFKTLYRQHPSSTTFEHLMDLQRSLKTL